MDRDLLLTHGHLITPQQDEDAVARDLHQRPPTRKHVGDLSDGVEEDGCLAARDLLLTHGHLELTPQQATFSLMALL